MAKTKFKTAYVGDNQNHRTPFNTIGHSRTKQAPHAECDINQIMAQYQKTGVIEHLNEHQGDYSDFLSAPDYHTALNQILEAQSAFDTLPSNLRNRFTNDPAQFLDFVQNPANAEELISLGLANPVTTPSNVEDAPAEPVSDASASPAEPSPPTSS